MPPGIVKTWGLSMPDPSYRFGGFDSPNYTPTPDALFDELAPNLTEAELRVLLYIIRRTFGFKRDADAISLSQLVSGITTKDGRVLDHGTGMSRPGVTKGVKGLVEKGVIIVEKVMDERGENQVNVYRLRFREVVNNVDYSRQPRFAPVGNGVAPQETERQETETQEVEDSKGPSQFEKYDEARLALLPYAEDLGREFNDQAPLPSTLSRLANLHRRSGLDLDTFIARMMQARAITQERTPAIRTQAAWPKPKPKTAYFLAVLEDLLSQPPPTGTDGD
jgi:Bacteriophage replication protein O